MKFYFGKKIMENGLMGQKLWLFKVEVRVVCIARFWIRSKIARSIIVLIIVSFHTNIHIINITPQHKIQFLVIDRVHKSPS